MDLDAIWQHQERWNSPDRADEVCHWLLEFADTIEPRRWPEAPIAGARKVTKEGYIFLVRDAGQEVQIIGVFGPGMNWTLHARER
ncbi:hypothetical protein [Dongia sp.]|uniref:hypothetical protein n=1 Tax=Dongia sp. TaxID=1977262 RepID=UPI003750838D